MKTISKKSLVSTTTESPKTKSAHLFQIVNNFSSMSFRIQSKFFHLLPHLERLSLHRSTIVSRVIFVVQHGGYLSSSYSSLWLLVFKLVSYVYAVLNNVLPTNSQIRIPIERILYSSHRSMFLVFQRRNNSFSSL